MADNVKTEIIPCNVAVNIEGTLQLIRLGDVAILSGNLFTRNNLSARTNTTIGTVPAGYRPAAEVGGVGISNFSAAYTTIKPSGEIVFLPSASGGGSLYISAMCWKISQ